MLFHQCNEIPTRRSALWYLHHSLHLFLDSKMEGNHYFTTYFEGWAIHYLSNFYSKLLQVQSLYGYVILQCKHVMFQLPKFRLMGTMRRILERWGPTIVGSIKSANTHSIFKLLRNKSIFDTSILSPAFVVGMGVPMLGTIPNIYAISLQKSIVNSFSIASSLCLSFSFAISLLLLLHLSPPSLSLSIPFVYFLCLSLFSSYFYLMPNIGLIYPANIHFVSPNMMINQLPFLLFSLFSPLNLHVFSNSPRPVLHSPG